MDDKIELNLPQKNQKKRKYIPEFSHYFEPDAHWGEAKDFIFTALKHRYPQHFINGEPDYPKIGEELKNNPLKAKAAREIFISYFKILYKSTHKTPNAGYPYMEDIIEEFGGQITAHGVEEAKGGMYNLLMMAVSNKIYAPQIYWGNLVPGLPNISPVSHGPYYVIYKTPFYPQEKVPNNPFFSDIACILVPFESNKALLSNTMDEMVAYELTTGSVRSLFLSKLRSYEEFYEELLKHKKESRRTFGSSSVAPLSWMSVASSSSSEETESPYEVTLPESDDDENSLDWLLHS